ncbi:MAG: Holliday junction resolvase RuvX [Candidatus Marinimicrobia bacterium]|nr:Holliday junction resolvase RuvX [Candidatus Neomarinimicrobiota bacterium]MBT4361580.1 Holliday junction resolvase RuvX [Candidatus Neomarinimicrobiota bacterium]MBT4714337.1 Holliday junction resolvase RuvX [Candidatus Neomarinimicrobiota bacterium]MBT4945581.1 Holliday junction resolvase RuvX [Candidatus Neomarinimicrobiota bacterium]MBT5271587.1 Holliday junction resolvase RuvX [Candidatus Neomarinimicrobiota bacterium]
MGLALTDPLRIIASPYETLLISSNDDAVEQIREVIQREQVTEVVVGVPLRPGAEKSEQAKRVEVFIEVLKSRIDQPVFTMDESYSSVEAEESLHRMGKKVGDDKGAVDRIAAAIILKQYLQETQG